MVYKKRKFVITVLQFQISSKEFLLFYSILFYFIFCGQGSRKHMPYQPAQYLLDTSIFVTHLFCKKSYNFYNKKKQQLNGKELFLSFARGKIVVLLRTVYDHVLCLRFRMILLTSKTQKKFLF